MLSCTSDFMKAMKSSIKEVFLKFEFYDSKMNYISEYTKHITESDLGSISVDFNRSVVRNFSFSLNNKRNEFTWGEANLIWIDKRVKVYIGLKLQSGNIEFIPQGVFIISGPEDSHTPDGKITIIQGQDKAYLFTGNRGKLKNQLTLDVGLDIASAIKILADKVGETMFNFDPTTATVPYTLTYEAGSSIYDAISELAKIAKCMIYYDVYGYLRLKNIDLNDFDIRPSVWTYAYGDNSERFYAGNRRKMDESIMANHIIVYGGSGDTAIARYELTVTEDDPLWEDSPYSIEKIGDILYGHNDFNPDPLIVTNDEAKWRAKYELMKRLGYSERLTLSIAPNYLHDAYDIITIEDGENSVTGKYLIESFSIPLKPDLMSCECLKYRKVIDDWDFI